MDTVKSLYELKNIEHYHNEKRVLNIDKLILEQSKITGFFGPNGSGKSTLFSILSFVSKPTFGTVLFNGVDSKKLEHKVKQDIVILPQNPYLLKRSVFDNVAYGLSLRNDIKNLNERVSQALKQVGLEDSFQNRKWSQLSGGEAQRVALAARLILKPKVLILDEPTSGVDTNSAQLIKEAIFLAKQKWDTTLFISSHDHNWLNHTCDKKVALFQGKLVQSGSINLIFAPWKKASNGNLIKEFLCGQKLIFENSTSKKRDSIVMIGSDDIYLNKKSSNSVKAVITSIFKENCANQMLVEFVIGGITLNAKLSKNIIEEKRLLPGSEVDVTIDTSKACWI
ncbi:energy-coupling factor ABC transporter ATP-binding protein [Malaciobacter marinus]|uniref:ABC transporter ATP-binding protein n=1 Tax=Malaciobacter marinus TaxID=505249 RepID=A0ABX4LXH5_9BACT|nr:energy-coupling factor ABC transporter ATP-binding protein [Malaciobacter marinus]PHO12328.1 ABC transporter ATP-binding protein [Malaciobacter marinus]PHO15338.1 ABC transporter ATP-binding protein [Malaciobacter marinus]